jgi:hypothetical protein
MSGNGPTWEIFWDPGFETSLKRLEITWEIFDRLGRFGVDFLLQRDPYEPEATFTLGGSTSRYLHTRFVFPDLPAMVIVYAVNYAARTVTIQGAEAVWQDDFDPYPVEPSEPDPRIL